MKSLHLQFLLALRYLTGRKLRSALTTLAVMFGVGVIFCVNSLLPTVLRSFQATVLAISNQVDLNISHKGGEAFPMQVLDEVSSIQGVRAAHGFLARPINLPQDFFDQDPKTPDAVNVITLIGLDPQAAQTVHTYPLQSGRFLQPGDAASVIIASTLADNLGLQVGSTLALPTVKGLVDLEIVGILPPRPPLGNEEVLVTLPEAQDLLDSPGLISTIEVNYASSTDEPLRSQIESAVQDRLGDDYLYGALPSNIDLFSNLKLAQTILTVFGFLALFMGAFIIFNTFRTLVAERRRDIGMLRAVGASRGTVVGAILAEGLLQGGIGTLAGMAGGYLLAFAGIRILSPLLEKYVHLRLSAPVIPLNLVLLTILLGVGTTLLAGLIPAFSAGRVTPMESLRPSAGQASYHKEAGGGAVVGAVLILLAMGILLAGKPWLVGLGGLFFLLGLVLIAPALIRPIAVIFGALLGAVYARQGTGFLAQSNLTRQPARVAITASTTLVALAMVVAGGELAVSIQHGFLDVLQKSLGSDYLFIPPSVGLWANNVGARQGFADQLRQIDGVGPVSTLRFTTAVADIAPSAAAQIKGAAQAGSLSISLLGIDPLTFPQVSGLQFVEGDAQSAYQAIAGERAMIVNGPMSAASGLKPGDSLPLLTPEGKQVYRVAAVAGDYLNAKTITAYISQANLEADFHKTEDVFIQLNLKPGADVAAVEPAIKEVKRSYPQFTMISGQQFYEQNRQLFTVAFSGIYLLFVFLAIPSLIAMLNTLAISVIERTREIGMLRAVGAAQAQVRRMVLAEALLLAAVGTAFGLLAGLYLGYLMILAFKAGGFPVQYYFPWAGLVAAIAIGLLFGALAAIIPARQAARLNIVEALRYE